MKKNVILASVFVAVVLFSCKPDKMAPAPSITGITPASGRPGDTVTITGNNFSTQASDDIVALNSKAASVINATGTTLTVEVPTGATTGRFSVTVNGNTGVSTDNFTVLPPLVQPPVITSFTPAGGAPGIEVTITGTGFSPVANSNTVKFADNKTAVVTAAATTWIKVTVPQGAVTGNISLAVSGAGAVMSATVFTVPASPVITSFAPALGLPGDTVVVRGTGFSSVTGDNTVKFADNAIATVTASTSTQLTVVVPASAVKGTLSATVAGQSGTSTATFEVLKDLPRNGLVAFYPFSGNAKDASGHAFDLTLFGNCVQVADRFGLPGKAYDFGVNPNCWAMSTDDAAAQVAQPITVGFWIKYFPGKPATAVSKDIYTASTGVTAGYQVIVTDNNMVLYTDGTPPANAFLYPVSTLLGSSGGQWIFFLQTFDGATAKAYINGTLAGTSPLSGTISSPALSFMNVQGGIVDDVTVYNRVLSDAEIQQLYSQTGSKK